MDRKRGLCTARASRRVHAQRSGAYRTRRPSCLPGWRIGKENTSIHAQEYPAGGFPWKQNQFR